MDSKRRSSVTKKKKNNENDDTDQNLLKQSLKLIESLYNLRLIQKIARPIDKKVREEQIDLYGAQFEKLHSKLKKIKTEVIDIATSSQNANNRGKSVFGQATSKPGDWKKVIRNIEIKYVEVFIDGSFKFFKKTCSALHLNYSRDMNTINIEQWAASCLDSKSSDFCC